MKLIQTIYLFITLFFISGFLRAQHDMHHVQKDSTNHKAMPMEKVEMSAMEMDSMPIMTHTFSRNLPMSRNGSGTSWAPDATPVYAYMKHSKSWNFMFHGSIFLRQNWQNLNNDYKRGGKMFDAPNWLMGMAQKQIGKRGLFSFMTMISLDGLTVGGNGYPLLFQSGESWEGKKLVDRQHPHDLFSELSIGYTHMVNRDIDISIYVGYPGEPALGPTAFMHRISSFNNPDAPIGHHWQDATHIIFGVATLGVRYKIIKVEGSGFTGREPNENRYNFDKPKFDSYSYRLSFNPNQHFSFQFSQGYIKSAEELEPNINITRTTASVMHSTKFNETSYWNSTLVWGVNSGNTKNQENSILFESNLQLNKLAFYGRYEWIQKSTDELDLTNVFGDKTFAINTATLGLSYNLINVLNTNIAIGGQGALYSQSSELDQLYGKNPVSVELYLHFTPGLMDKKGMMKMGKMKHKMAPMIMDQN